MVGFDYERLKGKRLEVTSGGVQIGDWRGELTQTINCGEVGTVPLLAVAQTAQHYLKLTNGSLHPQFAALVCATTADLRPMAYYFPVTNILEPKERNSFFQLMAEIMSHPNFRVRAIAERGLDVRDQLRADIPGLIAGHLAEIFFFRRDILDRFMASPRNFWLYTNQQSFEAGGGLAGGDYNPEREAIELVMSRLYEGYGGPTAGVAPFLHELGHMLDHYDCAALRLGYSRGFLPGLNREDGPLFTPQARELFIRGKREEQKRYESYQKGQARKGDPWPVGHPYVFQNDTEFIAGYFEMFFRNPNYFAEINPDLYKGFTELLQQDPRRYWPEDFPHYRDGNRKVYVEHEKIWAHNISVPSN